MYPCLLDKGFSLFNLSDNEELREVSSILSLVFRHDVLGLLGESSSFSVDKRVDLAEYNVVGVWHFGNDEVQEYECCENNNQDPYSPEDDVLSLIDSMGIQLRRIFIEIIWLVQNIKGEVTQWESQNSKEVTHPHSNVSILVVQLTFIVIRMDSWWWNDIEELSEHSNLNDEEKKEREKVHKHSVNHCYDIWELFDDSHEEESLQQTDADDHQKHNLGWECPCSNWVLAVNICKT